MEKKKEDEEEERREKYMLMQCVFLCVSFGCVFAVNLRKINR